MGLWSSKFLLFSRYPPHLLLAPRPGGPNAPNWTWCAAARTSTWPFVFSTVSMNSDCQALQKAVILMTRNHNLGKPKCVQLFVCVHRQTIVNERERDRERKREREEFSLSRLGNWMVTPIFDQRAGKSAPLKGLFTACRATKFTQRSKMSKCTDDTRWQPKGN